MNNNRKRYELPNIELLEKKENTLNEDSGYIEEIAEKINALFLVYNIDAKVTSYNAWPSVIIYEVQSAIGVPINKIEARANDIKLMTNAKSISILAPISGKSSIWIAIPNIKTTIVKLRELFESDEFNNDMSLKMAIGIDVYWKPVIANLAKMPHLLIAGDTETGKSVCLNTIIISLIMKLSPEELKLILIDPKMAEFKPYNEIPHLIAPVITDMKKASQAFKWAVKEMIERYNKLVSVGARDITKYNAMSLELGHQKLPYIVIIVDELANLMTVDRKDCEAAISRLAAMARAVGIHLILATQRPSADVLTGLIKANFPARIAFQVSSSVDSKNILDSW